MTRRTRTRIPAWAPLALALVIGVTGYLEAIQPRAQVLADAQAALASRTVQVAGLEAALRHLQETPEAPLPIPEAEVHRLWPQVVERAVASGYEFQLATFTPPSRLILKHGLMGPQPGSAGGPLLTGSGPAILTMDVSARFTGPYLPLDQALDEMESIIPLWTWKTVRVAAQEGTAALTVSVTGTVPLEAPVPNQVRSPATSPAARRPAVPLTSVPPTPVPEGDNP